VTNDKELKQDEFEHDQEKAKDLLEVETMRKAMSFWTRNFWFHNLFLLLNFLTNVTWKFC